MKKNLGKLILSTVTIIGILSLTACGNNSNSAGEGGNTQNGVQIVTIGCSSNFENVSFLNEDGELDGFEIELLRTIDELLPQYEFEYNQLDMQNILMSLDAGRIDLGTCNFAYTEQRAENYMYANEPYRAESTYFLGLKGTDLTWEGLAGKTVATWSATDNQTTRIETYNAENPDKAINVDYIGDLTIEAMCLALAEGRWDASYTTTKGLEADNEVVGDKFELGDMLNQTGVFWLYPKDDEHVQLRDDIDEVLGQLKEDGTLDELAMKWLEAPAFE